MKRLNELKIEENIPIKVRLRAGEVTITASIKEKDWTRGRIFGYRNEQGEITWITDTYQCEVV